MWESPRDCILHWTYRIKLMCLLRVDAGDGQDKRQIHGPRALVLRAQPRSSGTPVVVHLEAKYKLHSTLANSKPLCAAVSDAGGFLLGSCGAIQNSTYPIHEPRGHEARIGV